MTPTLSKITAPDYCPRCRKIVKVKSDPIGLRLCDEVIGLMGEREMKCQQNLKVITKVQLREIMGVEE